MGESPHGESKPWLCISFLRAGTALSGRCCRYHLLMPAIPVSSPDDPRIAPYRAIRGRDPAGVFIVESEMLALRLLASRFETLSLLCAERWVERMLPHVPPA